jgi:uncharacterized protein (TIGR00156 family)
MQKLMMALVGGIALFATVQAPPVQAQYVSGQATSAPSTVAEVLKSGYDDQRVVLRGQILRRVYGDKYIFSDGTGEIRVDIDQEEWPSGQPVNDKTIVEIIGKIDLDWGRVSEVDVKVLRVVK